jgi:hypothetical protein
LGLYNTDIRATWPGTPPDQLTTGSEEDLSTIYPPELGQAILDLAEIDLEIKAWENKAQKIKVPKIKAREKKALKNDISPVELFSKHDKLIKLIKLHNRRARGAHLTLAKRLGGGWPQYLASLGALVYLLESFLEPLKDIEPNQIKEKDTSESLSFILSSSWHTIESLTPREDYFGLDDTESIENKLAIFKDYNNQKIDIKNDLIPITNLIKDLRLRALDRLLECETTLFSWWTQGLKEAPTKAPSPLVVPDPPRLPLIKIAKPLELPKIAPPWRRLRIMIALTIGIVAGLLVYRAILPEANQTKSRNLYVYNGLNTSVTVILNQASYLMTASSHLVLAWPQGPNTLKTLTKDSTIESFDSLDSLSETLKGFNGSDNLVYNIAGASPLIEWTAIYSGASSQGPMENFLGAPVFYPTKADYIFSEPPQTITVKGGQRTKLVLSTVSGLHPSIMLAPLDKTARDSVTYAHAKWDDPEALLTAFWLATLVKTNPDPSKILLERLKVFPLDPLTNELYASLAPQDEALAWCESRDQAKPNQNGHISSDNSQSFEADQAFLRLLCLPPSFRPQRAAELLEIYPDQPWLNRFMGLEHLKNDNLLDALNSFEKALSLKPQAIFFDLENFARLRHFFGVDLVTLANEFGPWDPFLARLSRRSPLLENLSELTDLTDLDNLQDLTDQNTQSGLAEPATGLATDLAPELATDFATNLATQDAIYALLEKGQLSLAQKLAGNTLMADKILILAAGTPGIDPQLAEQALSLPPERIRAANLPWLGFGLALNSGSDTTLYEEEILAQNLPLASRAIDALKTYDPNLFPDIYLGQDLLFQGKFCLAAYLALKDKAPPDCPAKAAGFLFPGERPPMSQFSMWQSSMGQTDMWESDIVQPDYQKND